MQKYKSWNTRTSISFQEYLSAKKTIVQEGKSADLDVVAVLCERENENAGNHKNLHDEQQVVAVLLEFSNSGQSE